MSESRRHLSVVPILAALALLLSCGGDATAPADDPETGTVSVRVTTTGQDPDEDGYQILLGGRTASLSGSGTATFEDLAPGSYDVRIGGVAANCSVDGGDTRNVTVSSGTAQVEFTVTCIFDLAGLTLEPLACPGLAPPSSGMPFTSVPLGALPTTLERPLLARVSWSGGEEAAFTFVDESASPAAMIVPVHPSGSVEGGEVEIRISDETRSCPSFSFQIELPPAAPGELTQMVTHLQTLIRAQAELYGSSLDALLTTPVAELPTYLVPLAIAQSILDDPSNENSLRAFAEGTAPALEGTSVADLERFLAQTGLVAELDAAVTSMGEIWQPGVVGGAGAPLLADPGTIDTAFGCLTAPSLAAGDLHFCMELALERGGAASASAKQAIGNAIALVGTLPWLKPLAKFFGSALFVIKHYEDAVASTLPSEFVDITVQVDPAVFQEDQAGFATWNPAEVWASSEGWEVSSLLLESLLRGLKATDLWKESMKQIGELTAIRLGEKAAKEFFANVYSLVSTLAMKQGIALGEDAVSFTVPPEIFGPVDISDPEWSTSRVVLGTSVVRLDHNIFEPREVGVTQIEVTTAAGRFGGSNIATDAPFPEIRVEGIQLTWDTDEIFVEPGELYTFVVEVHGSRYPTMVALADPEPGFQGTASLELGPDSTHLVHYTAPASPNFDDPDLIVVRHTAKTGARLYGPERSSTTTVRFGQLEISPRSGCVEPGGQLQLQSELRGPQDQAIEWSVEGGGEIDGNGRYTAPSAPATVTVRAHARDYPNLDDEVTLTVGGCSCSYSITVEGSTMEAQAGDELLWIAMEPWAGFNNELTWIQVIPSGSSKYFVMTFRDWQSTQPVGPGSYPGDLQANTLGAPEGWRYDTRYPSPVDPPETQYATIGIDVIGYAHGAQLSGTASGSVILDVLDGLSQERGAPFSASFTITVPPDYNAGYSGTYSCIVQ